MGRQQQHACRHHHHRLHRHHPHLPTTHLYARHYHQRHQQALGKTVIVVDEVDDLVVNEAPNAHYVKKDVERTPEMQETSPVQQCSRPPPR